MIRNYRDLTRLEMEQVDKKKTIVMIPVGALEQHGNQAPLGTDDIIAEAMLDYLKEELPEDFPMLYFPVIPVGLSTEHKNFCGSITLKPDTYYHMLHDICESLHHHGFKKIAFLVCHGGNAPIIQVLSRELRSEYGLSAFILSSGAFSHPDVKATISEGNIWDFHGGEMETSMVMAVHPECVKLETSVAGRPEAFCNNKALLPYGAVSIGWVSEDWKDADGNPIGIGGDPSGASAEKGDIILRTSAKALVPGLLEILKWEE
ncbi:creatinine amidohydrolase [Lachnospiraceae bacterium KM106-2]|nr:creatinine amidohydrolase [Lachnospiraceae bacterium KM106-2]